MCECVRTDGRQTLGFPLCSGIFFFLWETEQHRNVSGYWLGKCLSVWVGNVRCSPVSTTDSGRENQQQQQLLSEKVSTFFGSLLLPNRYCAASLALTSFIPRYRLFVSVWAQSLTVSSSSCSFSLVSLHNFISP